jgi:murein DD-endopeptidase MepM/ murein hydrolase activator NlpD
MMSIARSSSALNRGLAAHGLPAATVVVSAVGSGRTPVLEPRAGGPAVRLLQTKLGVRATGWYGPMTLAAVTRFQRAHRLPATGYVGPRTWALLLAGAASASTHPTRSATSSRPAPDATVSDGRVCPAPGFSGWGQGWGAARGGHRHQGMDMIGGRGTPILAMESGRIIREGRQSNGALRIVMQGVSGSTFYYGHMSRDLVRAGQRVSRGQVIGLMGDSGSPGAVHLHVECWQSGGEPAAVDPEPLLRRLC